MLDAILKFLAENELAQGGLFLGVAGTLMMSLRRLPSKIWSWAMRRLSWTLEIRNDNSLFNWTATVIQTRAKCSARTWLATSYHDRNGVWHMAKYPAQWMSTFCYEGRRFLMWRNVDEGSHTLSPRETLVIQTARWNKNKLDDLLQEAITLAQPGNGSGAVYIYHSAYAEWKLFQTVGLRELKSVILPQGTVESVSEDVQKFLASRDDYQTKGLPWHRGYLFHGEPGNGKTSLISGLAREFQMNLSVLHLDGLSDATLMVALSCLPSRSLLVLEDVDCVVPDRDARSSTNTSLTECVTLSGLLNVIDGLATPDGQIVVMTTNKIESLDPALTRPGRVDVSLRIGAPDDDQRRRLFERLRETSQGVSEFVEETDGLSMAEVQQKVLAHD